MGYYLLEHRPASRQFYDVRMAALTGGVAVHTTESVMDTVSTDTGAENVAAFIAGRKDPGSYHVIVDSDSAVPMVPDSYTAFHIAAPGHNSRTWSIAFACRTTDLDPDHWWTQQAFKRAAVEIVGFWRRNRFPVDAANRWLTPGQTLTALGLFHHGTAQPADRSDAFAKHPQRDRLAALLSAEIAAAAGGNLPPINQEDEMVTDELWHDSRTGAVYLTQATKNTDGSFSWLRRGTWLRDNDSVTFYRNQAKIPYREANPVELAALIVETDGRHHLDAR